ncbi:hypothetical protein SAMN05444279_12129 [Ruegeria intermedia]|uniref:Tyr recombinase domain-containing protein n=1 Tax=Ruegeria intermedia TaxID=996115 RepID=A0A1M4ZSG2_9RHOB|nr:hypothetical protein [Ruegeria intermedia]SHF20496.1 hypothetical protein SAMN05444279_12129 [Ruegeria intermedia]
MTTNLHLRLLADIRSATAEDPVPGRVELSAHLERRIDQVGNTALAEFTHVQRVACQKWGAERTAHFGQILRSHRVAPKPPRKTVWARAEEALRHLPAPWRQPIADHLALSRQGKRVKGRTLWSAAYAQSVVSALKTWAGYCAATGADLTPTGAALDAFGHHLIAWAGQERQVTTRSVADYMQRILSGMALVQPDFASAACDFVAEDWRERAKASAPSTKTGAQLVGASAIYDLGFRHIDEARARPMRGLHAARQFRNGLILALGTALPQRARALSCLAFDSTLLLLDAETLGVRIPASMLKLPEDRKRGAPFERSFRNAPLAAALLDYRRSFRPIFDDGLALFPSVLSRHTAISEKQIGRLTGDMTEAAFGVRIPIHRLRDNVATEASETLNGGGRAATALLGHKSQATTARHYDHSEGIHSAQEFGDLLASHRDSTVELDL